VIVTTETVLDQNSRRRTRTFLAHSPSLRANYVNPPSIEKSYFSAPRRGHRRYLLAFDHKSDLTSVRSFFGFFAAEVVSGV
jgi:hypothetical protein